MHILYYRYSSIRKDVVKPLVDNSQYQTAKTQLEDAITEHNNFFPDLNTQRNFNFGEKIIMEHAKNHLDSVISDIDPPFIDSDGQIKHQSDIVKEALVYTPKQDYSDT